MSDPDIQYHNILKDLKEKIRLTRLRAAIAVNKQLLAVYWEIGHTILQQQKTEGWGAKIISRLAQDLKSEFPDMKGLSQRNLVYMQTFAAAYPQFPITQVPLAEMQKHGHQHDIITQELLAKLTWYHHITLLDKVKTEKERLFYMKKAIENGWSRNVMVQQIESRLYLRQATALHNFDITLPPSHSDLARETLKNPYVFDFLGITEEMQERELEKALVQHIKKFMLELGKGFAYIGNQFNLNIEGDDYFLDLLFYNYHLHCFFVFELKVGDFKPEYAGKLNFYINTVNEQLKGREDKPTIGVLLCKTPNETVVKYALKGIDAPMGVAQYQLTNDYQLTNAIPEDLKSDLPTIEDLEQELKREMEIFKGSLETKLDKLKELISKSGREEIQKEKTMEEVKYLFNEVIPDLIENVKKNLGPLMNEFARTEIVKLINHTGDPFFTEADLEAKLLKEDIRQLGFTIRLEGFKKAGTNTFGLWKDLFFVLEQFKYSAGPGKNKFWIEKLYHQKWTKEEIISLADRWCEEVVDEISEKLENII